MCKERPMKLKPLLLFFLAICFFPAQAQERSVNGMVTSASDGLPLIGVNIVVKGTLKGTITDIDGRFALPVPDKSVLLFTYIGFTPQEVFISKDTTLKIALNQGTEKLDEVVVIGYGTVKKSDVTGALSTVTEEMIKQTPVAGIDQALQGHAPGVTVVANTGQPGSAVTVRIRGTGTVNNSNPLYVVDGVSLSDISFLNPNDIQSMEVLKDASATAIYGSRGANGVIMITTRQGKGSARMNATLDLYTGVQNCWHTLDLMNREQYAKFKGYDPSDATYSSFSDWVYKKFNLAVNSYIPTDIHYENYDTDWQGVVFRDNARISNVHLTVDGGTEKSNYAMGIGYFDQDGIIITSNFKRITFRINSAHTISKYVKVGENLSLMNSKNRGVATNNENYSLLNSAICLAPWDPVRYPDGRLTPSTTTNLKNPLSMVDYENPKNNWNRLTGDVYTDISPWEWLTFKSDFGLDLSYGDERNFKPKYYISANDNMPNNFLEHSYQKYSMWLWENTATFHKTIARLHDLTVLAGMTAQDGSWDYLGGSKTDLPNESSSLWYLDAATENPTVGGRAWEWSMLSYLGRVQYAYNNRYLLTFNIRRDGSSRFGKNNRWGVFPSLALGWKISEEKFFAPLTSYFNTMKLRVGWGRIGNQEIGNYAYTTTITSGSTFVGYVFGAPQALTAGAAPLKIANEDLKWESTEQTNVGLDFSMFGNKLTTSMDYFIKDTKDMLVAVPVPGNVGLRYYPMVNAGSVRNSGFELVVDFKHQIGGILYSVGGNLSTLKNKVLSLGGGENIFDASFFGEYLTRTRVGDPIGSFYGYKVDGIFQDKYDVEEHVNSKGEEVQPAAKPGDFRFVNQNDDNKIDDNDKVNLGNPFPKLTYGLNGSVAYRNFDLQFFFQGVQGNKIFNCNKYFTEGDGYTNLGAEMVHAWSGKGTSNTLANPNGSADNLKASSHYIEDGSYLRLKNLQVGYKVPQKLATRAGITGCRFYLSVTNLFTMTDYTGFDPEIGITSGLDLGVDRGTYPQARTFTLGATVNF